MGGNAPVWIQEASIAVVAMISIIVGVYRYIKTEGLNKKSSEVTIPANNLIVPSLIDTRLLRELIDALRENQEEVERVGLRLTRSQADLREGILDLAEAVRMQTDASINLVRFMKTPKGE